MGTGLGPAATSKGVFCLYGLPSSCRTLMTPAEAWRIQNQSSQSKCIAAATKFGLYAHIQPHQWGHGVRTWSRLHTTLEVRHPSYSDRRDCCQLLNYELATRIKSFAHHTCACFCALTAHIVLSHLQTPGCCNQSLGPAKLPTTKPAQGAALLPHGTPGPWDQTMRVMQGESMPDFYWKTHFLTSM